MRGLGAFFFGERRRPFVTLPIDRMRWRHVRHAFPPHTAVVSERHVGENGILRKRFHRVGIGLIASARGNTKEASLRIDSSQAPVGIRLYPRNVIANGPDFPALLLEVRRRDQHGKICFATCTRESGGHISLLTLRVLHTKDQHVLSHPAFIVRHRRSDAQRKTFFTEQCVAAVTGTVAPDLARLREVHNVFLIVRRPRHVLLAFGERRTNRVHTGHHPLKVLINQLKHFLANARHNAHVDDSVRRVG